MVPFRAHLAGRTKMNVRHPTFNAQCPTGDHAAAHWMFDVRCSMLVVSLCLFLGNEVFAPDPNPVLDSWFAAQANLHTWSADFVQTRRLQTLTQPLVAT